MAIKHTTVSFKASIEFCGEIKEGDEEIHYLIKGLKELGIKIEHNQLNTVYESEIGTSIFGPLIIIKE